MRQAGKWVLRILGGALALLLLILVIAAFLPVPQDELPPPEAYGAGASSAQPSVTGLEREFPSLNEMSDNPGTPEKVELGRMLFFDPLLSENNDIACATCHHPDYSFADGLPQSIGEGGEGVGPGRSGGTALARNAPSLWNVGYANTLFWDGRVESLEYQVLVPLQHTDEMGVTNTNTLEAELAAIPEYANLFEAAFGAEGVTVENAARALASFERTLISNDSPFDRYAAGDLDALTASQRRGLTLFRSAATRCFECHTAPTFASETFRVIGAPDAPGLVHDAGRAAVVADGIDGAFKVPTLRNVALTAPYMHNGIFATLEEVIDFYADGGGRADGLENIDPFVRGFDFSEQEKADLVAFLYALTDESGLPEIPAEVPSRLPVVPALDNPAREAAAAVNTATGGEAAETGAPQTITVEDGETIQAAVDRARPGDTILVPYGVYHERVVVDFNDITLLGVPNGAGEWPVLDGQEELSEAVISSGNNFEVGFFRVVNYTDNGILVEGVTGVYLHDIYAENIGIYGLYPVQSTDVLIERAEVIGVRDAGIYAGQCENVVIRDSVAHGNVLGIEVENTVGAQVYNNHTYDNTLGILVVLLPQLTSKVSLDTKVYGNFVEDNNTANFADAGTAASIVPAGSGIGVIAADRVEVYGNTLRGNRSVGIGVFSLLVGYDANEVDVGPTPEHVYVHDNTFENNGYDPDTFITELGIPGADILWDVSGWDVRFDEAEGTSTFPPLAPTSRWPDFAYRMYWQGLNFLIRNLL
jgi:parallel beta-helix repeat protein